MTDLVLRGRCWRFGDNIACDGQMMPVHFFHVNETRPEILAANVMRGVNKDFPKNVRAGDIVVAGKQFGWGHPHHQGMLGLAAAKIGLVVESIPRASFRNAINAGVPLLPRCPEIGIMCADGDELEVDFRTGEFINLTSGISTFFCPLPENLLHTITIGGWKQLVRDRLSRIAPTP